MSAQIGVELAGWLMLACLSCGFLIGAAWQSVQSAGTSEDDNPTGGD